MKDARIADHNSTTKSLKGNITTLEKLKAKLQAKFVDFQRQSSANIAKLEHKKELFHIKEQKKMDLESKRKMEKIREKEKRKRKLEQAISMNKGFTPTKYNKGIHEQIINNFRDNFSANENTSTNLKYASAPRDQF